MTARWRLRVLAVPAAVTAWCARRAWLAHKADLFDQMKVSAKQVPVLEAQLAELQAAARQREADTQDQRERFVSTVFIRLETETSAASANDCLFPAGAPSQLANHL